MNLFKQTDDTNEKHLVKMKKSYPYGNEKREWEGGKKAKHR